MKISDLDCEFVRMCKGNRTTIVKVIKDKKTGQHFVLKKVRLIDPEKQIREIEIHKTLSHQYIVNLLDIRIEEDYITLLLEYAEGGDLFSVLPVISELDREMILELFIQILEALAYLHEKNIVHRDIKPENILLDNDFKPKLADFGTSSEKRKIKDTYCGTIEYMAPEVWLRQMQNEKVDIWAIGVLLYEIINGHVPFSNTNIDEIQETIAKQELSFKKGEDVKVVDFVYKCLRFDPLERPNVKELLQHEIFDLIKNPKTRSSLDDFISFIADSDKKNSSKGESFKQFDNSPLLRVKKCSLTKNTLSPKKIKNLGLESPIKYKKRHDEIKKENRPKKKSQVKSKFFRSYREIMNEKQISETSKNGFSTRKTKINDRSSSIMIPSIKDTKRSKSNNNLTISRRFSRKRKKSAYSSFCLDIGVKKLLDTQQEYY